MNLIDMKNRHMEIQKMIKEEENSSLLAPYLKKDNLEMDPEMFKSILKLEILNKAVNNLDKETEMTRQKVENQKEEKLKLIELINNEESKLAELINKAQELSERMDRLKKGNMKVISVEVDQMEVEVNIKNREIYNLESELTSAQKHYDENKIDLGFQKNLIKEKEKDTTKDINAILNNPNKDLVVKQLNEKIKLEQKLTHEKTQQILKLEHEFSQQRLKKSALDSVVTTEMGINTDHDMSFVDKMITKFNKTFFQTDIQV